MTEEVSRPKTCVGCITGADCVCSEQAVTCERKQQLWDSGYAFCSRSMKRAALLLAAEAVQDKRHEAERAAGNPDILPGEITRLLLEAVVKQFRLAEEDLRSRAELALPVTTEPHMHTPVIGNLLDRTIGPTSINDVCACGATRRFYLDVDGRWEACAWVEPTPAACPDCGAIGCTGSILAEPEPEPVVLRAGEASSTDGGKTWLHDKSGEAAGFGTAPVERRNGRPHLHEPAYTRQTQRNGRIQECKCGAGRGEFRGEWTEWIGGSDD